MSVVRGFDADTRAVYEAAGFTGAFELGTRPALVVVDFCRGFTDPQAPLGSDMSEAVSRTRGLLDVARAHDVLCVFTSIAYDEGARASTTWLRKVPSLGLLTHGSPWVEIDPRLGMLPAEPLILKPGASAFFGTPLGSMLVAERIDTVLVAGATTSGCVRATVVDSVQLGYGTFVVTDCVADRAAGPHEANLSDMAVKYADPLTSEEVVGYFEGLSGAATG